jgi:hypothetical protein
MADPSERLYRYLGAGDANDLGVKRESLELPNFSVDRAFDQGLADFLAKCAPDGGVAFATVGNLPPPLATEGEGILYEFFAEHLPTKGNWNHSEIRVSKKGQPFDPGHKPKSKKFEMLVREELARRLTVLRSPVP